MIPTFRSEILYVYRIQAGQVHLAEGPWMGSVSDDLKDIGTAVVAHFGAQPVSPFYSSNDIHGPFTGTLHTRSAIMGVEYVRYEMGGIGMIFYTVPRFRRLALRTYFARMLFAHWSQFPTNAPSGTMSPNVISSVVELFEKVLLYRVPGKQGWEISGRARFISNIAFWVRRSLPIRFCLPAFPCKTTNPDKAAASVPDGAEYEALITIHAFCAQIQKIYDYGVEFTIVSDGHVFSDCTGVDDATVSLYTQRLQEMSDVAAKAVSPNKATHAVRFSNLRDLLLPDQNTRSLFDSIKAQGRFEGDIAHPIATEIDPVDDECRQILVHTCAPVSIAIRTLVRQYPAHSLTALYRGFSRFMFEDLASHDCFKDCSISYRKRAAERVAFEMMLRNQAYSNLVELVMPNYIRLSIHAHDNAGPKFGIKLLPTAVGSLNDTEIAEQDLHIPTPWHNAVADVPSYCGKFLVLVCCKAKDLRAASFKYDRSHPRGGRFVAASAKALDLLVDPRIEVPAEYVR